MMPYVYYYQNLVSDYFGQYYALGSRNKHILLDEALFKRNGQIGIVVPALIKEFEDGVPDSLKKHWDSEWYTTIN